MTPNEALLNFRAFLVNAYPAWRAAAGEALAHDRVPLDKAFDDWAQANWELLVERPLCGTGQFLEIYGAGSDYEAQSFCRVFFRDALPTHKLICESSRDRPTDLLTDSTIDVAGAMFERLVARSGSWYESLPPFDHVLVRQGDRDLLVRLEHVTFSMQPTAVR
jgi:hypothetical protein